MGASLVFSRGWPDSPPAESSLPDMRAPQTKVLVASASLSSTAPLVYLFSDAGHEVEVVGDGAAALRAVASRAVDLLVLDLDLPAPDGLQVLRLLGAMGGRKYLPVIALAAPGQREQRVEALALGAHDVVSFPWDDAELLARVDRALSVRQRVDELVEENATVMRLSVTEPLTRLFNHNYFLDRLRAEFRRAQRYDDPLSVIFVDLDHFAAVNARLGRELGDMVLVEVARAIERCVRETDLVARYGGEEFAVLLPKTPLPGALTVAERIWREIRALEVGADGGARLCATLGVVGGHHRSLLSSDLLIRSASDALYRAKREGGDRIGVYQPTSDPAARAG